MPAPRKHVRRSFSACWTCRRRRVRCDSVVPGCTSCRKHSVECEGYSIELVWVDSITGKYPPLSRRSIDSAHTWSGWPVLDDEQLQRLVEGYIDDSAEQTNQHEANPFTVFAASNGRASPEDLPCGDGDSVQLHNPVDERDIHHDAESLEQLDLTTFDGRAYLDRVPTEELVYLQVLSDATDPERNPPASLGSLALLDTLSSFLSLDANNGEEPTSSYTTTSHTMDSATTLPSKSQIPRSLLSMPQASPTNSDDAAAFYHYMTWVAPLMVPVDNAENPWKTVYPSTALQDMSPASRALYHAMLAQAAFNLANLHGPANYDGPKKTAQALEHYGASLRQLCQCLGSSTQEEYNACMATLHTLVITGAYARQTLTWRDHFSGAGGIVTKFVVQRPWSQSSHSWVISQSLALSFEIAQTSNINKRDRSSLTDTLLESVSSRDEFGFTIGSSGRVLQVISEIRDLSERIASGDVPENLGELIQTYIAELTLPSQEDNMEGFNLETSWGSTSKKDQAEYLYRLHLRLFRNAATIYFFRIILNVPPQGVVKYVSTVLQDTLSFLRLHGGAVSMWPVFIAAVEAYEINHQQIVEQWLDISSKLGIQNRRTVRQVILAVWEKRSQQATKRGIKQSQTPIDWRQVQQDLGLDLLLL
ncbi:fungal-specific transcription factor domain-containing protein [Trichoderma ceciliae]